jgi:hypothetical protein
VACLAAGHAPDGQPLAVTADNGQRLFVWDLAQQRLRASLRLRDTRCTA